MNVFDLTGQTIGSYLVGELIGKGAMGVVYLALKQGTTQEVALKVLPPELHSEEEYFKRFKREASTSATLKHPRIVPVFDYGTHEVGKLHLSYLVMQLLRGGSLAQRLKTTIDGEYTYLSPQEVISITKALADALDYAHSKGVVHRDIKPGNIMFDDNKQPSIVDFGIAKLQDATRYTQSNATLGTPAYMAPEQWMASTEVTPATDQYALAVMVYEMLSGQYPFKATTSFQFAYKHLHEFPTSILEYHPQLPFDVDEVLLRALEKEPTKRYATMMGFAEALEAALKGVVQPNNVSFSTLPPPDVARGTPPQTPLVERQAVPFVPIERSKTYDTLPLPFTWVKIPSGEVTLEMGGHVMGINETFRVETFWMSQYPITNAQFMKFIEAEGYRNKRWWTDAGWALMKKENWTAPRGLRSERWSVSNHPVVGVTWYEAVAFCQWLSDATGENIMLPTEQQWQRAAQGDDGRCYPWGNDWDTERCNSSVGLKDWRENVTSPVTRYEGAGDSPYRVSDMVGNVWEWCLTQFETGSHELNPATSRVLRGGSWGNYVTGVLRVDHRSCAKPEDSNMFRGFRIART